MCKNPFAMKSYCKGKTHFFLCNFFNITHTRYFWSPNMLGRWGVHPLELLNTKQFCDISQVSYNLTQLWHYLPGDSVRFHQLRAQSCKNASRHFKCQLQAQAIIYAFDQPAMDLRVHDPLPLRSISLLRQLKEPRKSNYALDYWLVIKGSNLGTGGWQRCTGKGKALPRRPQVTTPLNLHAFTNPETLRTLS